VLDSPETPLCVQRLRWVWCVALAALLGAACLSTASPAYGQSKGDRNAARKHAVAGYKALRAGRHRDAIRHFREAEALVQAPTHRLYMARAHRLLGELLKARALYEQLVAEPGQDDEPKAFTAARRDAATDLAKLKPRIPALELRTGAARLSSFTLDGKPVAAGGEAATVQLDPGEHDLAVVVDGQLKKRRFSVSEGQTYSLELLLQAREETASSDTADSDFDGFAVGAIVAAGLGLSGIVVGAVAGLVSLDRVAELEDRCPDKRCLPADQSLGDEAAMFGNVSTVGFVLGGLMVATSVSLLVVSLTDGDNEGDSSVHVGPTGLKVRLSF
jgi:hypothetical protein